MERYYQRLDKEYDDIEMALESIRYEIELMNTFGPAIEKADSTVASTGSGGTPSNPTSPSSDPNTGSTAADNIEKAGDNLSDTSDAKKEAEKSKDQTNNKADSKSRQDLMSNIKKVQDAIMEFINKHLTDFRANISTMLNENANTVQELDALMRGKKPNLNMTIKDFNYNDSVIKSFSDSLNSAFVDYGQNVSELKNKIVALREAIANGNDEEKTKLLGEIGSLVKSSNADNNDNNSATYSAPDSYTFERPTTILAKAMKAKNADSISFQELKKFIYNSYKGLSDNNTEPSTFNLQNNAQPLHNAELFLRNYKETLKGLNTTADRIRTNVSVYKDMCEAGKGFTIVDDKTGVAFDAVLNRMSRDLSEFVNYSDYLITMVKERGISSEYLIRRVYGGEIKEKNTDKKTNNKQNQNNK